MKPAYIPGKSYAYLNSKQLHIREVIQLNDFTLYTFHLAISESSPSREKLDEGGELSSLFCLKCQKEIHYDLYVNEQFSLGNAFCKVLQWGTGRLIHQRKLIHHQSETRSSLVRAVNRALGE